MIETKQMYGKELYYKVEFLIVYNCAKFHGSIIICSKVTVKYVVKNVTSINYHIVYLLIVLTAAFVSKKYPSIPKI